MGNAAHLMTDTVTKSSWDGTRANSGDPSFGSQSTIKARVDHENQLVKTASGNEEMSSSQVISESEILITDRVWLPGDDTTKPNESKQPLKVAASSTPGGYTLYRAWL
jgi:hypothetical protein